jgi:hypothetical protein
MANCRKSGDQFEAIFINLVLEKYNTKYIDKNTEKRIITLLNKSNEITIGLRNKLSKKIYDFLDSLLVNNDMYSFIKVNCDKNGCGKNGDTTDIELITENNNIFSFSLKKNNLFVKHPRPNALATQIGHKRNSDYDKKIKKEYSDVVEKYTKKWLDNKHIFFETISIDEKYSLYEKLNEWYVKKLNKMGCRQISSFLSFLLSPPKVNTNKFMVIWQSSKNDIQFIKINQLDNQDLYWSSIKVVDKNYIHILLKNNIKIRMRLHTSSKKIGINHFKYEVLCEY